MALLGRFNEETYIKVKEEQVSVRYNRSIENLREIADFIEEREGTKARVSFCVEYDFYNDACKISQIILDELTRRDGKRRI